MTKLVAGPGGLDMTALDFSDYPDATPTTASPVKVIFPLGGGVEVEIKGSGFTYDGPNEFPADGEISSLRITNGPVGVLSITKMSLDVSDMRGWLAQGQLGQLALANAVFGGNDKIYGSQDGSNTLIALGGADLLVGGLLDDTLDGGAGVDSLLGGRGSDLLFGGADADVYVYQSTLDSRKATPDIIVGLTNDDTIDLRAIDANVNKDGNQGFSIVDAFSHKAGEMTLTYNSANHATTVLLDVDGDAKADMVILIDGGAGTDHSDFTNFAF
jgi:peptidase M10/serralysin-like protein